MHWSLVNDLEGLEHKAAIILSFHNVFMKKVKKRRMLLSLSIFTFVSLQECFSRPKTLLLTFLNLHKANGIALNSTIYSFIQLKLLQNWIKNVY